MSKTTGNNAHVDEPRPVLEPEMVKVLAHPLRHQILVALSERVASPKELSVQLRKPLGNVSYHVRVLADLGCIELVSTTPRRGAVEHHYRAVRRPYFSDEDWASLPLQARREIGGQRLGRVLSDIAGAAEAGGFDRTDVHVSWTPLDLDDAGYREVTDLLEATLERVFEIQAESLARQAATPSDDGEDKLKTQVTILHFLRA